DLGRNRLPILKYLGWYRNNSPGGMAWTRAWITPWRKRGRTTGHPKWRPTNASWSPVPTNHGRLPESATDHRHRPKPAKAGVKVPCPAVVSHPAPGLAGSPRVTHAGVPSPPTIGVRRPTCSRVWRPAESAAGKLHPFAIGVKITPAIARSQRMHGLIFCRKHDLLIPCVRPVVPSVLLNPFLGVESQLGAAGITFQGPAFAESGRLGWSGDIHRATKNLHAKAVLFQVRAEFALAIRRHRGVSDLDVINVTGIGLKNNDVLCPSLSYRGR